MDYQDEPINIEQIEDSYQEPNWALTHFLWLIDNELIDKYCELINNSNTKNSEIYYLKGLMFEYGIQQKQDINQALHYYMSGAEKYKDSYCLLRLYFLSQNPPDYITIKFTENQKYLYLIRSAAYFDYYIDIRYKTNPLQILLSEVLSKPDIEQKLVNIIKQEGTMDEQFLLAFIQYQLSMQDDIENQNNAIQKIISYVNKSNDISAAYFLAELIRNNYINNSGLFDLNYACNLYKQCIQQEFSKAYTAYAFFLIEDCNDQETAKLNLQIGSQNLCFKSMNELASIIFAQGDEEQYEKGINYLINSFLLGYMYSIDDFEFLITKTNIIIQQKEKYFKLIYQMANAFFNNFNVFHQSYSDYGPQFYILSHIYSKGLYVPKNLNASLQLLEDAYKVVKTNKKYIIFKLGILLEKLGKISEAQQYYKDAFLQYNNLVQKPKHQSSTLYYRIGKYYEKGYCFSPNKILAYDFYKLASDQQNKNHFIQKQSQLKAQIKIQQLKQTSQALQYNVSNCLYYGNYKITKMIFISKDLIACISNLKDIIIYDIKIQSIIKIWYQIDNQQQSIYQLIYCPELDFLLCLSFNNLTIIKVNQLLIIKQISNIFKKNYQLAINLNFNLLLIEKNGKNYALINYNHFSKENCTQQSFGEFKSRIYCCASDIINNKFYYLGDEFGNLILGQVNNCKFEIYKNINFYNSVINSISIIINDQTNDCRQPQICIISQKSKNIYIINYHSLNIMFTLQNYNLTQYQQVFLISNRKNKFIICGIKGEVLDAINKEKQEQFVGHTKSIIDSQLYYDQKTFITIGDDKRMRLWTFSEYEL